MDDPDREWLGVHRIRVNAQRTDLLRLVRTEIAPTLDTAGLVLVRGLRFCRTGPGHQACVVIRVNAGRALVLLGLRYGDFAAKDVPDAHQLTVSAYLGSGGAGRFAALWDLSLGDGAGGSPEAARELRSALVSRGLVWLALHEAEQADRPAYGPGLV